MRGPDQMPDRLPRFAQKAHERRIARPKAPDAIADCDRTDFLRTTSKTTGPIRTTMGHTPTFERPVITPRFFASSM